MPYHIVMPGDTLWRIATEHLGDPTQWRVIARANNIGDDQVILIGQRLYIPEPLSGAALGGDPATRWLSPLGSQHASDPENTSSLVPARGFLFVLADEINPLARKIVRKVMVSAAMAESVFARTGRFVQTIPNPEKFGMFPSGPESPVSVGRHAMGMKPSRFSSASDHAFGSSRFSGNRFWIDVDKARSAGAAIHETQDILADLDRIAKKLVKPEDIQRLAKIRELVRADAEVLIEGPVPPTAIKGGGAMAATRALQGVQIIGFAVSAYELSAAANKSVQQGSVKPISAEVIRQAGGWAAAWAGVKLGALTGAAFGVTTGPGAVVAAGAGAVVGGVAGYFGFDWIADHIDAN